MTVCTDQPPQGFIGTFLIGTITIGARYQDATCGRATCGYAITGMWWAYLCPTGLALGGQNPEVRGGSPDPLPAGLVLSARLPALVITSTITVPAAVLALGSYVPVFAGQVWVHDSTCDDVPLVAAGSRDLVLTAAGARTLDLQPEVCR